MLLQPLLDKSSTWLCEVTNFECDMSEELAFPENEHLFTIVRRPTLPDIIGGYNNTDYEVHMDIVHMNEYLAARYQGNLDLTIEFYQIWGYLHQALDSVDANGEMIQHWTQFIGAADGESTINNTPEFSYIWTTNANWYNPADSESFANVFGPDYNRETHFLSKRYYSTLDFVNDIATQVSVFDRTIRGEQLAPGQTWEQVDASPIGLVSFSVDSGGNMFFTMKPEFTRDYMIILSPLFQHITGFVPACWVLPGGTADRDSVPACPAGRRFTFK